jgi:hypothetical protein
MNLYPGIHAAGPQLPRSVGVRRGFLLLVAGSSLLAAAFLFASCGDGGAGGGTASTNGAGGSFSHPTGAREIVLQVTQGGGFVPVEYNLTLVPAFSLYGDGRVIVSGPVPEIYPGPALPNLQTAAISEDSIQAILSAAREAGLFDPTFDYGRPTITDVATTSIVINADGTTYPSDIYALGMEAGASGLTLEQQQARAAVGEFLGNLMDLGAFEAGEIVWKPYEYTAVAVFSQPADPANTVDPSDVQPNSLDWPLGELSALGEPVQPEGFRRVVISGEDLATLKPLLDQATMITLWKSGGQDYHLYFRPLLPEDPV